MISVNFNNNGVGACAAAPPETEPRPRSWCAVLRQFVPGGHCGWAPETPRAVPRCWSAPPASASAFLLLAWLALAALVLAAACEHHAVESRVYLTVLDLSGSNTSNQHEYTSNSCDIVAARARAAIQDRHVRSVTFLAVAGGGRAEDSAVLVDEVLKRPRATGHSAAEQESALGEVVERVRRTCVARLGPPRGKSPVAQMIGDSARVLAGACAHIERDGAVCVADVLIASDFTENVDGVVVAALKTLTKHPESPDATRAVAAVKKKLVTWPAGSTIATCGALGTKKSPYTLDARIAVFTEIVGPAAAASLATTCPTLVANGGAP